MREHGSVALALTVETSGKGLWSKRETTVKLTKLDWEQADGEITAYLYFDPNTWDVERDGLIYTDPIFIRLLKMSLAQLERTGTLPKFGWENVNYTEQGQQGADYVHLIVGVW